VSAFAVGAAGARIVAINGALAQVEYTTGVQPETTSQIPYTGGVESVPTNPFAGVNVTTPVEVLTT
jgi:hypothetical protein